jgi:hypothetical protein
MDAVPGNNSIRNSMSQSGGIPGKSSGKISRKSLITRSSLLASSAI